MNTANMYRSLSISLCLALTAVPPATASQGAHTNAELATYARDLVDSPAIRSGDAQAAFDRMAALLRADPGHPFSEAALFLMTSLIEKLPEPDRFAQLVDDLDAADFDGGARNILDRLQARMALGKAGLAEGGERMDLYPTYLRSFAVLGPMGPRSEALALENPSQLFAAPGLGSEHEGLDEELAWQPHERHPFDRHVRPYLALRETVGDVFLCSQFHVPASTPEQAAAGARAGWIEIEARGLRNRRSAHFPGMVPGYAFSLNGAEPVVISSLSAEQSDIHREPVVLLAGANRLVVRCSLWPSARVDVAIRILDSEGRPLSGLQALDSMSAVKLEPARGSSAPDPADTPVTGPGGTVWEARIAACFHTLRGLVAQPDSDPVFETLLAILLSMDGREAEGLAHAQAAHSRAPEDAILLAHLALFTQNAGHLPEATRRARARMLVEQALALDPNILEMQVFLAREMMREDREEEVIAWSQEAAQSFPRATSVALYGMRAYEALNLSLFAETAFEEALGRAPGSVRMLKLCAERLDAVGRHTRAAAVAELAAEASWRGTEELLAAAALHKNVGATDKALALYREVARRGSAASGLLIGYLIQLEQYAEARSLLEAKRAQHPHLESVHLDLAHIAQLQNKDSLELEHLSRALALKPARLATRERMLELGSSDAAGLFLARGLRDVNTIIAGYDAGSSEDSLVALLDHALLWIHDDGAVERVTQNLHQVRDLQACEQMGTMALPGDVIAIASIDGKTGERFEPVQVDGQFVMPGLKPGDFVESVYRTLTPASRSGRLDLGGWFFASIEQTFLESRYVVSMPEGFPVRVREDGLEGVVDVQVKHADGRETRTYLARDMQRVLLEPQAPPLPWILPQVELNRDMGRDQMFDTLTAEARWYVQVTPEIRAAAEQATQGLEGDDAKARALHAYLNQVLDERSWNPPHPTQALLARTGNALFLYLSLLKAVGVPAELVWARGQAPAEDAEPKPRFSSPAWWRKQPLILVQPRDAEAAWCDLLNLRLLPYGELTGSAPESPAFATLSGAELQLPARALAERPGFSFEGQYDLQADGQVSLKGTATPLASIGYNIKEQVLQIPTQQHLPILRQQAAQLIPGLQVKSFEIPGIDEDGANIKITVEGAVRGYLVPDAQGYSAALPFPALRLGGLFASEGERRLPFFLGTPFTAQAKVTMKLGPGLSLVDPPQTFEEQCAGGSYRLSVELQEDGTWLIERRVMIDAFIIPAEEHAAFLAFCAKIDEAERARLSFVKK